MACKPARNATIHTTTHGMHSIETAKEKTRDTWIIFLTWKTPQIHSVSLCPQGRTFQSGWKRCALGGHFPRRNASLKDAGYLLEAPFVERHPVRVHFIQWRRAIVLFECGACNIGESTSMFVCEHIPIGECMRGTHDDRAYISTWTAQICNGADTHCKSSHEQQETCAQTTHKD